MNLLSGRALEEVSSLTGLRVCSKPKAARVQGLGSRVQGVELGFRV